MATGQQVARAKVFLALLQERLVILDGAMGTMIQRHALSEAQFRGERFAAWRSDLRGNNDLLSITQPAIIGAIHREYLLAGADVISTNTFNSNAVSQSDYGMQSLVGELNQSAARLARRVADEVTAETGKPRFVAGALGPTSRTASLSPDVNDPGFRNINFDELVAGYSEAARALIEGGVDLILIETVFDTLNAKAALYSVGYDQRRVGQDLVGPDHRGVLEFHTSRAARRRRSELRARRQAIAPVYRGAGANRGYLCMRLPERGIAECIRRIRRNSAADSRDPRRIRGQRVRQYGGRLLRHHARPHSRRGWRRLAPAAARVAEHRASLPPERAGTAAHPRGQLVRQCR